jgi:hypothetical protein
MVLRNEPNPVGTRISDLGLTPAQSEPKPLLSRLIAKLKYHVDKVIKVKRWRPGAFPIPGDGGGDVRSTCRFMEISSLTFRALAE